MNQLIEFMFRCLLMGGLSLLLITCTKEVLPQPTQTGSNTFGCLINGKVYIPDGGRGFMPAKPVNGGLVGIQSTPYRIGINIYTYSKDKQKVELFLNDYRLGQHRLNSNTQTHPAMLNPLDYGLYRSGEGDDYVTSSTYTGWVDLTKADTTTGIVAGSFAFTAATPDGRTVTISEGRFDVNYRTQ